MSNKNNEFIEAIFNKKSLNEIKELYASVTDINAQQPDNTSGHEQGYTALQVAAAREEIDIARFLLDHGALLELRARGGNETPLETASDNKKLEMIKLLLSEGAKPNILALRKINQQPIIQDAYSNFSADQELLVGIITKDIRLMQQALDRGADVDALCNIEIWRADWRPLHLAADQKNSEALQLLLSHGANTTLGILPTNETPEQFARNPKRNNAAMADEIKSFQADKVIDQIKVLKKALNDQNIQDIKTLIENGANINTRAANGDTALLIAILKSDKEMVAWLLSRDNINIEILDYFGFTALFRAVIINSNSNTIPHFAAASPPLANDPTIIQLLLNANAKFDMHPPHRKLSNGQYANDQLSNATPIIMATVHSTEQVLRFLLEKMQLNNQQDSINRLATHGAAAHYAASYGYTDKLRLLINFGADLKLNSTKGITPEETAAAHNKSVEYKEAVKLAAKDRLFLNAIKMGSLTQTQTILKEGVDKQLTTKHSNTAIQLAAKMGHTGIVKALSDNQLMLDSKNTLGWTALHWAAANGKKSVVKFILEHGVDINGLTTQGETPEQVALQNNNQDMAEFIKRYFLKVKNPTIQSDRVIRLYQRTGNEKISTSEYWFLIGRLINEPIEKVILHGVEFETEEHATNFLTTLRMAKQLSVVKCRYNKFPQEHIKLLCESLELINLNTIELVNGELSLESLNSIAKLLEHSPDLHQCDLSGNSINLDGFITLAKSLENCKNIKKISFAENNIDATGISQLRSLTKNKLIQFNLAFNSFTTNLPDNSQNCVDDLLFLSEINSYEPLEKRVRKEIQQIIQQRLRLLLISFNRTGNKEFVTKMLLSRVFNVHYRSPESVPELDPLHSANPTDNGILIVIGHLCKLNQLNAKYEFYSDKLEGDALELIKLLIARGTNVNQYDAKWSGGALPLHLSLLWLSKDRSVTKTIITLLLNAGADPLAYTSNGTALDIAANIHGKNSDIYRLVEEYSRTHQTTKTELSVAPLLEAFARTPDITHLNLDGVPLGSHYDRGARQLISLLKNNRSLISLDCRNTEISPSVLAQLKETIKGHPTLTRVRWPENQYTVLFNDDKQVDLKQETNTTPSFGSQ